MSSGASLFKFIYKLLYNYSYVQRIQVGENKSGKLIEVTIVLRPTNDGPGLFMDIDNSTFMTLLDDLAEYKIELSKIMRLVDIYKRWNFNDSRVGCKHQKKRGLPYTLSDSVFGKATSSNCDELRKTHADVCPDCGHEYGDFCYERLPPEVVKELKLFGQPSLLGWA